MVSAITYGGEYGWGNSDLPMILMLSGTVIALSAGVYGWNSIKCPKCGAKWLWLNASQKNAKGWDQHILLSPNCPACEKDGNEKTA